MAKSKSSGQFVPTEYEFFIDALGWHNLDKYRYDNNLNMIQDLNQNYDSTAGWVNSNLTGFSYDALNRDTGSVSQYWDTTSAWVYGSRTSYSFDVSNNLSEGIYYNWVNPSWALLGRDLFTYDANNNR